MLIPLLHCALAFADTVQQASSSQSALPVVISGHLDGNQDSLPVRVLMALLPAIPGILIAVAGFWWNGSREKEQWEWNQKAAHDQWVRDQKKAEWSHVMISVNEVRRILTLTGRDRTAHVEEIMEKYPVLCRELYLALMQGVYLQSFLSVKSNGDKIDDIFTNRYQLTSEIKSIRKNFPDVATCNDESDSLIKKKSDAFDSFSNWLKEEMKKDLEGRSSTPAP